MHLDQEEKRNPYNHLYMLQKFTLLTVDLPQPPVDVLAHVCAALDHRVDHALLARRLPLEVLPGANVQKVEQLL